MDWIGDARYNTLRMYADHIFSYRSAHYHSRSYRRLRRLRQQAYQFQRQPTQQHRKEFSIYSSLILYQYHISIDPY
jgi:hypothetical protein